MMKTEQFDVMPSFSDGDTAAAREYLGTVKKTLTAGVVGISLLHEPEGTRSFYAAAATLLSELDPRFPSDWLYSHIMTYREMLKPESGYGMGEVMGILGLQLKTFAEVGREAYEKL